MSTTLTAIRHCHPRPEGGAPAAAGRRRWVWLLALIAALALGASLVGHIARGAIASRLAALAASRGLEITYEALEAPLLSGATLRGVSVTGEDGALLATIDAIETDVSLVSAIGGQRRPEHIAIRGATLSLHIADGRLRGWPNAAAATVAEAAPGGPARPLVVVLDRGRAVIDLAGGGIAAERVVADGIAGSLSRDAAGGLTASLAARVTPGERDGATRDVSLTLGSDGLRVAISGDGLVIGGTGESGPVWVGARGLRADPRGLSISGIGLRRGQDHLRAAEVTVHLGDHGDDARRWVAGLLPHPDALRRPESVTARDVSIGRNGARLVAARATVTLGPPDGRSRPVPRTVEAVDVGVAATQGNLSGTFAEASITLSRPWQALEAGRPLDAVSSVRLGRPTIEATVAERADALQGRGGIEVIEALAAMKDETEAEAEAEAEAGAGAEAKALAGPEAAPIALLTARFRPLIDRMRTWRPHVTGGAVNVRGEDGGAILALRDLALSTEATADGGATIAVAAAALRDDTVTGRADVRVTFAPDGALAGAEGRLSGRDVAHQLSRFASHVDVEPDSEVDLRFTYRRPDAEGAPHRVSGSARLSNFTFAWWRLATDPITGLDAAFDFDLALHPPEHRAVLDLREIAIGDLQLTASVDVIRRPGAPLAFKARLTMPRQDCGAAARAIPRALIPRLSRLALRGRMAFDARLDLDLAKPRDLELKVTGDADDCQILSLGPGIDLGALKRKFVHRPTEPERGLLTHIRVGRGSKEWIPADQLTELAKATAWVTEDRRYFAHTGVRWDLIERAMKMDLEHGRFVYGGSTITQQLVKNLYLDRGKTLARKLEEAIIAWKMERVLTKDEILTLYINCIEYGPDIYGFKHAARFYFNKAHDALNPLEVAFIMGLKPYPYEGYKEWKHGALHPWWIRRVTHIFGMLVRRTDVLTAEEAATYAPYQPAFRAPDTPIDAALSLRLPATAPTRPEDEAWAPWGLQPDD